MNRLFIIFICISAIIGDAGAQIVDSTFGYNGYMPYGASGNSDLNLGVGNNTVIQSDGKIVVAIDKSNPNDHSDLMFSTYRYNADGSPDSTFGDGGVSKIFAGDQCKNMDVKVQPDGKIVVLGESEYCIDGVCGAPQFVMMRLLPDGKIDSTFNNDGIILSNDLFGDLGLYANPVRVSLLQNGKYIIGGQGVSGKPFIARININGKADSVFAVNGIFADTSYATLVDMALDNNGFIYGLLIKYNYSDTINRSDNYIFRIDSDGVLDNTFGTGGRLIFNSANVENPTSIAIRPDNKIIIGGYSQPVYLSGFDDGYGETNVGYVIILNPDGSPCSLLPQGFRTLKLPGDSTTFIQKVLTVPGDKILFGGRTIDKIDGNYHERAFICLMDENGTLDTSFHHNGYMIFDYGLHSEIGSLACFDDLDLLPDGSILATGYRNPISFNTTRSLFMLKLKNTNITGPAGITPLETGKFSMHVYPVPFVKTAFIEYEISNKEVISLELRDMTGRLVLVFINRLHRTSGKHTETIDIPSYLSEGVYNLVFSTVSGLLSSGKIIYTR
ncbi:MAG: T9SS type A sorting domain-containing protein [Bacteroidia bacterium]|nr:T9SS type A sorting domain-containing protein [Bacteroidia bacterium]